MHRNGVLVCVYALAPFIFVCVRGRCEISRVATCACVRVFLRLRTIMMITEKPVRNNGEYSILPKYSRMRLQVITTHVTRRKYGRTKLFNVWQ